ncbi:MAG: hypothetical protein ACREOO_31160 [bacterium]
MKAGLVSLWRKRTPAQKLSSIVSLRDLSRQLVFGNIRALYPDANELEVTHQLLVRFLDGRLWAIVLQIDLYPTALLARAREDAGSV